MKKSSVVFNIIFGIVFLALGVFLFTLRGESPMILAIAIADLVFSVALFIGGLLGLKGLLLRASGGYKNNYDSFEDIFSDDDREQFQSASPHDSNSFSPAPAMSADDDGLNDHFNDDIIPEPEDMDFGSMSPEQIKSEELRLRTEARRSAQEARSAMDEAKLAMEKSDSAEQALAQAEAASRQLTGAEQRRALQDIDRLRQQAYNCSREASAAKQRARYLRDQSKQAALLHSKAVEAAVSLMDDDF